MSAGETVRVWRHAKIRRRPGAMVDVFQREVEYERTCHGYGQPEKGTPPPQPCKDRKSDRQLNDQDVVTKKRDRVHGTSHARGRIAVHPLADRLIEMLCISLQHFVPQPCEKK